ncbi:rpfC [Symbiodinium sp. CCMP2592]|nr:rpfC [Symbiodinium sp. CCMP2592]
MTRDPIAGPTTPVQSWVIASPQAKVYATVTCQADAHRCMQMLYNLVTNALKYTVQGEVHVTAAADDENQTVTLEVSDTGIGIGQAARERIFLPFEQEDQSDSRRYEGLGLGLAISRAVAEKHGGTLTVESEVGKGSSFKATLPYEQPEYFGRASPWDKLVSEGHQAPTEAEPDDPLDRTRNVLQHAEAVSVRQHLSLRHVSGQVLVVDDDQQTRHYVRDVLQRTQAEVVECASSHECMSLLHTGDMKPALIIMDVILSDDTQGFDLLKWLRARYGFLELPIIVISSDTSRECMLSAIEAGCNEWLKKPFNKEELLARLSLAMRVADEVASNGLCPGLSSACSEDIRGVAMHMPDLQKRRSSASRLSVPSSRLGRPSLESNDLNVAPRSVSSGLVLPMPECEEESHSSSDSSDEPSAQVTKTKSNKSNSSVREPAFQQVLSRTETSPKAAPTSPVERVPSASARRRSGPQVPPEQFHQLHGLDCYRLLGRLLPVEAVQQLVCGEVIEPQRCPNAAVLTASLQGVDDVESDVLMNALGHFLDVLGTLSTAEGIVFFSSAELGASFVAVSGLQGTPGHEIQLVRFALAMRDRLDELRKALSSAGEASQLSLAIGLDMGKATRLVLGRLSPHAEVSTCVVLQ